MNIVFIIFIVFIGLIGLLFLIKLISNLFEKPIKHSAGYILKNMQKNERRKF